MKEYVVIAADSKRKGDKSPSTSQRTSAPCCVELFWHRCCRLLARRLCKTSHRAPGLTAWRWVALYFWDARVNGGYEFSVRKGDGNWPNGRVIEPPGHELLWSWRIPALVPCRGYPSFPVSCFKRWCYRIPIVLLLQRKVITKKLTSGIGTYVLKS